QRQTLRDHRRQPRDRHHLPLAQIPTRPPQHGQPLHSPLRIHLPMTRPALSVLLALLALPTSAAEPDLCKTVALHPVVVNGTDTGADRAMISEIQAVAAAELLKRQRTLQDSSIVSEA